VEGKVCYIFYLKFFFVGHLSKNCTYEDNRICFHCGGKGHITKNCPVQKKFRLNTPPLDDDEEDPEDI
jgi:hypothetical protein